MANSDRKAIQFLVQSALPPHDTNVLWMDTAYPTKPVLKTFNAGAWISVCMEDKHIPEVLAKLDEISARLNTSTDIEK